MKVMRPLVMALALISISPVAVYSTVAEAAETAPIGPTGLVEILPIPTVMGDGETAVDVHVVAISPDGSPFPGVKFKVTASTGTVSEAKETSAGIYSFQFTPTKTSDDVDVTLTVKGKSSTRASVEGEYRFTVQAMAPAALEGTTNPAEILLGKVDEATLSITGGPKKGELLVHTSAGQVTNLTNMGGGKHTARFVAPEVNFPQFAVVTMAHAADPGVSAGYAVIPMHGSVDYPVQAKPDANVMLKIGDKEYGPVKASPEGRASVPVVVPPGVSQATLVSVIDGESSEEVIDLRVPETKLLALYPVSKAVPADSALGVTVRIAKLTPKGEPDTGATLSVDASAGTITAATHEGNGVYRATWTPPDGDTASTATITASIAGSTVQTDSIEVSLVPRRPTSIAFATDPSELSAGTEYVKLVTTVQGSDGKGMAGQLLTINTLGASAEGAAVDIGNGKYESKLKLDNNAAKIGILIKGEATGNPVRHIALVPASDHTLNDGATGRILTVASVDAYGYPVANQKVTLKLQSGDGVLPANVTTDDHGLAQLQYTSGTQAGLVRILASTVGATGATSFIQAPEKTAPVVLPLSGSAATRAVHGSWNKAVLVASLAREAGAAAPVVAAAPAAPAVELGSPDAAVASVDVSFFPEQVQPGAEVTVRAIPKDADGKAIPGKTLDVMTSRGDVGDTTENEGVYDTVITMGADFEGEAKVSLVAGDVMKLVKVPVSKDAPAPGVADAGPSPDDIAAGPAWGSTAEPEPEPEPEAAAPEPEPAKIPREPKEAGEIPFMRARLSGIGSLYNYSQVPSSDPGPLLPQQLVVGGDSGGRAATPFGFELNGRVWMPDIQYLGFNGNFRTSRYAIAATEFDGDAPDWLYDIQVDVIGRYPFEVNGDQYWVGAKAGLHYNDFMIFTGCLDPGCQVNFDPLGLTGLGIGVEAGLEVSSVYAIAGFTEGLANFSVPYSTAVDVNVGYQLMPEAFIDAGFTLMSRSLILEGTDSGLDRGELADSQLMFKIGGGFSM